MRLGRAQLVLARRMLRLGRYERAAHLLDQAGSALRGMPELHALAARTHLALGNRAKAREHLDEGEEGDPDHTPLVALRAAMALEGRDQDGFHASCGRLGEFGKRVVSRAQKDPKDALQLLLAISE
ncbi:tetratricopeptide repeat protein [bacterium]|nr:MAG: tetratricopeptide repeat protein [bacterium]